MSNEKVKPIMKTVEQWFDVYKAGDLPVEAAKVLVPGPGKHDMQQGFWGEIGTMNMTLRCRKCEVFGKDMVDGNFTDCTVPDPINVNDWNVAMAWRQQLYPAVIREIWMQEDDVFGMWKWWAIFAQPHHYIIAACMAQESKKEI